MGLKQVLFYFFPYRLPIAHFPRRMALEGEDVRTASRDELTLIEWGLARTPKEARRLLRDGSHALDIIKSSPQPQGFFKRRLRALLMRIEGTSDITPLARPKDASQLNYKVKFKE